METSPNVKRQSTSLPHRQKTVFVLGKRLKVYISKRRKQVRITLKQGASVRIHLTWHDYFQLILLQTQLSELCVNALGKNGVYHPKVSHHHE